MTRQQIRYVVTVIDPYDSELIAAQNAHVVIGRLDGSGAPVMWSAPSGGTAVASPLLSDARGQVEAWLDDAEPPTLLVEVDDNSGQASRAGQRSRILSFVPWTDTITALGVGQPGPGLAAGGTTGQALIKASGTDFDTAWHTLTADDVGADVAGASATETARATAAEANVDAFAPTAQPGKSVCSEVMAPWLGMQDERDRLFAADYCMVTDIEDAGGRLNMLTDNYSTNTKAQLAGGAFGVEVASWSPAGGTSGAAVTFPSDGLLPADEWTVTFMMRSIGADYTAQPLPTNIWDNFVRTDDGLGGQGALMIWRPATNQISITVSGTSATITLAAGDIPADTWTAVTCSYKSGTGGTLDIWVGNPASGGKTASVAAPGLTVPQSSDRLGGLIVGSNYYALPSPGGGPFMVSSVQIFRHKRAPNDINFYPTAALTVDAQAQAGWTWLDHGVGLLGLYRNFAVAWTYGQTLSSADDAAATRQVQLLVEAGVRHVRVAGVYGAVGYSGSPGSRTLDFTVLDREINRFLSASPDIRLLVNMDYCPAILQPGGGSGYSVPTDMDEWASIGLRIIQHLDTTFGSGIESFGGWNEPDAGYFLGTAAQMWDMWSRLQNLLITNLPARTCGTPEFGYDNQPASFQAFFTWLATQSTALKNSINHVSWHDFQQNLQATTSRTSSLGVAMAGAGVPASVPIRLTEHNMSLNIPPAVHGTTGSWWRRVGSPFNTAINAAHLWAQVMSTAATAVGVGRHLELTDMSSIGTALFDWGDVASMSDDDYPRPYMTLAAIRLMNKLPFGGQVLSTIANWPNWRALAVKDTTTGRIALVYGSYRPWKANDLVHTGFQMTNMPTNFKWTHWQVDHRSEREGQPLKVGQGNQTNLPLSISTCACSVGAIEIVPS